MGYFHAVPPGLLGGFLKESFLLVYITGLPGDLKR